MGSRTRRLRCRSACVLAAGLCLALAPAAPIASGNGPEGGGGGGGGGDFPANQCGIFMGWNTTVRSPNLASAYSGYPTLAFSSSAQTALKDVAFVISSDYPYAGYGGWFLYDKTFQLPTSGLTFGSITPDQGSVNPYTPGTPIFARNRHYTALITADSVTESELHPSLRKITNRMSWQAANDSWTMLGRVYGAKAGYDQSGTGGPTKTAWPDWRTYNVKTGEPIDCANVQPARDAMQQFTPWNTVGWDGIRDPPTPLRPLLPQLVGDQAAYAPKPNPRLVEFFHVPPDGTGLPGGTVPPPGSDNCANYIQARIDQRQIAVVRVPKVPSFQSKFTPRDAVFQQLDTGAYNLGVYGQSTNSYRPGTPFTYIVGNDDIVTDRSGGATFVVWPRNLTIPARRLVFAKARRLGWNLIQSNTDGPFYSNSLWLRINGPASTYIGGTNPTDSRSGVPCMVGPQSTLDPFGLTQPPDGTAFSSLGEEWAATPSMMGSATPQGVQCTTLEYLRSRCIARLKEHIRETGGSYIAS